MLTAGFAKGYNLLASQGVAAGPRVSQPRPEVGPAVVSQGSNPPVRAPQSPARQLVGELYSADNHRKVEVWRCGAGAELEIRQLLWGSGVGWYVQQSLTLDAGQSGGLQALLG